jgi:queuine tRNA-ribosyltransferase subunit QTRTD1
MPEEVLQAVAAGVDLFDSTYPHMLTMGGYAMTFPATLEDILGGFANKNLAVEEWSKSGSDSTKICLQSVSFR